MKLKNFFEILQESIIDIYDPKVQKIIEELKKYKKEENHNITVEFKNILSILNIDALQKFEKMNFSVIFTINPYSFYGTEGRIQFNTDKKQIEIIVPSSKELEHEIIHAPNFIKQLYNNLKKGNLKNMEQNNIDYAFNTQELEQKISKFISKIKNNIEIKKYKDYSSFMEDLYYTEHIDNFLPSREFFNPDENWKNQFKNKIFKLKPYIIKRFIREGINPKNIIDNLKN